MTNYLFQLFNSITKGFFLFSIFFHLHIFAEESVKIATPPIPSFLYRSPLSLMKQKICIIGDTGTGSKKQYLVSKALEFEGCDQIRHVGDIIYPKGLSSKQDPLLNSNFFDPYKELWNLNPELTFYMTLGNHDMLGNHHVWVDLSKENSKIFMPHEYYLEEYDASICLITLNTHPFTKEFPWWTSSKKQEKWLKVALPYLDQHCKLVLGFGHHPYLSSGEHGNAKKALKSKLEEILPHLNLYFAGHDHHLEDAGHFINKKNNKKVRLFISGSGAKTRKLDQINEQSFFAISELGFLTIYLEKNEKYEVHFQFKVVETNQKIEYQSTKVVHEGIIKI